MVRLKVPFAPPMRIVFYKFQFLMVRLKVAEQIYENITRKITFQFLMVRLKEKVVTSVTIQSQIFQFLMVRLKVFFCIQKLIHIPYFNSLWCD